MLTLGNFTKIKHNVYGNPRYVAHFLGFLTEPELEDRGHTNYELALTRAKKFGGKKYHSKQYAGGIVFTSYALEDEVIKPMNKILAELNKGE